MPDTAPERYLELARRMFQTLERADLSIEDGHEAIRCAMWLSINMILNEAAAVGSVGEVQPLLAVQLERLQFYVAGWQPGAAPAIVVQEALEARASGTVN